MIGNGLLVQPWVFFQSGIALATAEFLIIGALTYMGVVVMFQAAEVVHCFDYSRLAGKALGDHVGNLIFDIAITINNTGSLLSYVLVIGTLIENVIDTYAVANSAIYLDTSFLTGLVMILFVLPSCLIRSFGHLSGVALVSCCAILMTFVLVIVGGPIESSSHSSDVLVEADFLGSISTVGFIVFALGYSAATFHSFEALVPRTVPAFQNVALWTTVVGSIMCYLTGVVGYTSFRNDTQTDILENFTGILGSIFKIAVIIQMIFYFPSDYNIMRASLCNLIGWKVDKLSDVWYFTLTVATVGIITVTACLLILYFDNSNCLAIVLELTGGISGSLITFILPGLIGVYLLKHDDYAYAWSIALIVVGVIIPIFVITSIVMTFIDAVTR
jgi:amino acid permease